ncbi:MAG TPA: hypothetical protein VK274_08930 [Pyrinomonadaceae bacterium]|nr:hypothetical protein [Pyrinomonadaceae bacterium]
MIYTRPFITTKFIGYAGDSRIREVSLAVRVVDAFTEEHPEVALSVKLKELPDARTLRGQRGFYCFEGRETVKVNDTTITRTTIPNGNYTIVVQPDPILGNQFYLQPRLVGQPWTSNFERPIVLPLPNPLNPLELVTFAPTPAYSFPANATLVRGTVLQGGAGAPDVVVTTTYDESDPLDPTLPIPKTIETLTDREGEFVLFFKRLPLKTQPITVSVRGTAVQIAVVITEGTTVKNQVLNLP